VVVEGAEQITGMVKKAVGRLRIMLWGAIEPLVLSDSTSCILRPCDARYVHYFNYIYNQNHKQDFMATELKVLANDCVQFTANGTEYYVKNSLSVERFKQYEKLQLNFGFGRTFDSIAQALNKSVDLANKGKGLEAWNIVFNLKEAVGKDMDKRSHAAFYLCALFICTEGEDLTVWDEQLAEKKIADWNTEGIDASSFFRIAVGLVNGFMENLEATSQDISEVQKIMEQLSELQTKD